MRSDSEIARPTASRGVLTWLLAFAFAGGVVAFLLASFASPATAAQETPSEGPQVDTDVDSPPEELEEETDQDPAIDAELPGIANDPFSLSPLGEGEEAQAYEDLDAEEQASVDRAGLWAETGNGHAVHSKWSEAAAERRREHRHQGATQLSGTQGLEDLGVE